MEKFKYDSKKSLKSSKEKINITLNNIDNNVFVFDFGHYIEQDTPNKYYFKSVIFGSEIYKNELFSENRINAEANAYTFFNGNIKQVKNIPVSSLRKSSDKEITFIPEPDVITTDIIFQTDNWTDGLNKIGINGCLFVYARKIGNYQSGVWLVLKNRIHEIGDSLVCFGFRDECIACQENITGICINKRPEYFSGKSKIVAAIEDIFHELEKLLMNELVYNAEEYAKRQEAAKLNEKAQKLVLEKFNKEILEAHSHTIFNCIPNLKLQNLRDKLTPVLQYFESDNRFEEYNYIKDIDDEIKNIHIRLTELNFVTHAALESPVSKKEKLFQEKTLSQLIILLEELTKNRCNPVISGLDDLNSNPRFLERQCQDVFTVLWNAWNNAVNNSVNQSFNLNITEDSEYIRVIFSNRFKGKINDDHLKLLRSEIDPEVYSTGIPIIKHLCNSLQWKTWAEVNEDNFLLELKINKFHI